MSKWNEAETDVDALGKALLTDDGKWWEFLDPATNSVQPMPTPSRSSNQLLDWSKVRDTQRQGAVGFGTFHRCNTCGAACPPDMTFCAHCGGAPRGTGLKQRYSLVIKDFEGESSISAAAEILVSAGIGLGLKEVEAMLRQPPAVFNLETYRERAAGLVQRLAEHGVFSKTFSVEDPGIPWFTETLESILREPKQIGVFLGVVVAAVLFMSLLGWPALLFGIAAMAWLFHRRLVWYRDHYNLDSDVILNHLSGFEGERASNVAHAINALQDKDLRRLMSVCVMEYYALHKLFQEHEEQWSEVLLPSHHALKDLIDQIVRSAEHYARLDATVNSVQASDAQWRLEQIKGQVVDADPRTRQLLEDEVRHLERTLDYSSRLPEVRASFAAQLRAMGGSLEAMRQRVTTLAATKDAEDGILMQEILAELDRELEIFEETVVAFR